MSATGAGSKDATGDSVLTALVRALSGAAVFNRDTHVRPAAILWPDRERQWERVVPLLRPVMPELLTLGDYDPASRSGPAIWVKCMLGRTLEAGAWPEDAVPVVYLPGVGRQDLRAVESCPWLLQPLVELQYRGVVWSQANHRDWTVVAFLKAREPGLGLDVAQDAATRDAMLRALEKLADTPVAELRGRRLEAGDFDQLLTTDPPRDLLRWLDDPRGARERWGAEVWGAFRAVCNAQYGFDPEADGELAGAELLGRRDGPWGMVWSRFVETPSSYPNVPGLLRRAEPPALGLFDDRSPWPGANGVAENDLCRELTALDRLSPTDARLRILSLESGHGQRRDWVWARLGEAPLALALGHLAELADVTRKPLPGTTLGALRAAYSNQGWRADAAVVNALAAVSRQADVAAVGAAVRAVYAPWADDLARQVQALLVAGDSTEDEAPVKAAPGGVLVFADGLRCDVGRLLERALVDRGMEVELSTRWAALPTVTATCKPHVAPITARLEGRPGDSSFAPRLADSGAELTTPRFRKLLEDEGYTVLAEGMGDHQGLGWAESGSLDRYGHDQGWKLARRVAEEVRELADRVVDLLDWGWREVTVVTDHGWLLLPGGLPKSELPGFLTETRWGRCGVLKPTASSSLATVPWRWCPEVRVALAPGIACFRAGMEYAHGGASLQELVTPQLRVRRRERPQVASIASVWWRAMRCRLEVAGSAAGLRADVRGKPADPTSSLVLETKEVGPDGTCSLVVENDRHEGTAAVAVLLDEHGTVIAKAPTTIGEEG